MAGRQKFSEDNIGALTRISSTVIELATSTVTIGGLQYDTSTLQCNILTVGVGGIDVGSAAADTKYYLYAIIDSSNAALVASVNSSTPVGFTASTQLGSFYTDSTGGIAVLDVDVHAIYEIDGTSTTSLNLPVGSFNAIDWNIPRVDTHNAVTTGASWNFKVPAGKAGTYNVKMRFQINDSGVGFTSYTLTFIRVNGSIVSQGTHGWTSGTGFPSPKDEATLQLAEGDEITFEWSQNSGPSRLIDSNAIVTRVEITRIGN